MTVSATEAFVRRQITLVCLDCREHECAHEIQPPNPFTPIILRGIDSSGDTYTGSSLAYSSASHLTPTVMNQ
jgi:hypothetical protein